MSPDRRTLVVTLRHNIPLESDVTLAERELRALLGDSVEVRRMGVKELLPTLINSCTPPQRLAIEERLRSAGVVALQAERVDLLAVPRVVQRAAFAQDILYLGSVDTQNLAFAGLPRLSWQSGVGVAVAPSHAFVAEIGTVLLNSLADAAFAESALDALLRYLTTGVIPDRNWKASVAKAVRAKQTTLSLSHDLHIYKAKFFPRLVRALINIFGSKAELLFDPFSGSGTALLEASSLGLPSLGIDLDPVSALISESKVEPFARRRTATASSLEELDDAIVELLEQEFASGKRNTCTSLLPLELAKKLERRDLRDGTSFLPEIEQDLSFLEALIKSIRSDTTGLAKVLFSDSVTKKVRYRFVGVGNGRYTIEVMRERILERLTDKIASTQRLCQLFSWLESRLGVVFAPSTARVGDARHVAAELSGRSPVLCLTSPPYLPASSGREHYAEARQLSFAVTGLMPPAELIAGPQLSHERLDVSLLTPSGQELIAYLSSDSDRADPSRDPMRFARKAVPTWHYLRDMEQFLKNLRLSATADSLCLLVVASQHTFYSHRRSEVEFIVNCRALYGEIATKVGWEVEEEIRIELSKHATSVARPQTTEDYFESVLVLRPTRR